MSSPIIAVENVSKEFQLGQLRSLKQTFLAATGRLMGKESQVNKPFSALNDVSFTVEPGEVLGIIGHNGAGKSTLLKILAGITKPTRGAVKVSGKVAPLIEVGAGLIGDLTGRENILLNGTVLGMSRAEIARKFDEIVSFAELEKFVDTPVKRYSSGMQVRLGFAIATSVNADILIVDEVLAVGDLAFQRKCFDRMDSMIRRSGRTVLLVTHNLRQVSRLCSRAILLNQGTVIANGDPEEICELFYEQANAKVATERRNDNSSDAKIFSSGEVDVKSVSVLDKAGVPVEDIPSNSELRIRVVFQVNHTLYAPQIIIGTHTTDFVYLNAGSTGSLDERPDLAPGLHEIEYVVPAFPLAPGVYCIRFSVYDRQHRPVFTGESLSMFRVTAISQELREAGSRILHIPGQWRLDGEQMKTESGGRAPDAEAVGPKAMAT